MEHNAGEFTVNGIPEPESGVYSTKYLKKVKYETIKVTQF